MMASFFLFSFFNLIIIHRLHVVVSLDSKNETHIERASKRNNEKEQQRRTLFSSFATSRYNKYYSDYEIQKIIQDFRSKYELVDGVDLELQIIEVDNDSSKDGTPSHTININGGKYSLDGLQPMNSLVPWATHRVDGVDVPFGISWQNEPLTWVGETDDESTIVVQKNPQDGQIQTIDLLTLEGIDYYMAAVTPAVFAPITSSIRKQRGKFDKGPILSTRALRAKNNSRRASKNHKLHPSSKHGPSTLSSRVKPQHDNQHHRTLQARCPNYEAKIAMAYDSAFCASAGGNSAAAEASLRLIFEKTATMYQNQGVCTTLQIVHIEGYCDANIDPFKPGIARQDIGCSGNEGTVQFFKTWTQNNPPPVDGGVASYHLFFHDPDFPGDAYGCANQDALCNNAHGVSNMGFTNENFRRAALFAHELGHNFGPQHVPDTGEPDYIMESVGFGEHTWSRTNLDVLSAKLPTYECIALNEEPTAAPTSPPTKATVSTSSPTNPPTAATAATPGPVEPTTGMSLQLQASNLCLNMPLSIVRGESDELKVWDCKSNERRQMFEQDGKFFKSVYDPTKCLSIRGTNSTHPRVVHNGAPARLLDCGATAEPEQQWWSWVSSRSVLGGTVGELQSLWSANDVPKCLRGGPDKGYPARVRNCNNVNNDPSLFLWLMKN